MEGEGGDVVRAGDCQSPVPCPACFLRQERPRGSCAISWQARSRRPGWSVHSASQLFVCFRRGSVGLSGEGAIVGRRWSRNPPCTCLPASVCTGGRARPNVGLATIGRAWLGGVASASAIARPSSPTASEPTARRRQGLQPRKCVSRAKLVLAAACPLVSSMAEGLDVKRMASSQPRLVARADTSPAAWTGGAFYFCSPHGSNGRRRQEQGIHRNGLTGRSRHDPEMTTFWTLMLQTSILKCRLSMESSIHERMVGFGSISLVHLTKEQHESSLSTGLHWSCNHTLLVKNTLTMDLECCN